MPVISLDGRKIADGKPGPVALRLRTIYIEEMRKAAALGPTGVVSARHKGQSYCPRGDWFELV
jgi:hypothetical protein